MTAVQVTNRLLKPDGITPLVGVPVAITLMGLPPGQMAVAPGGYQVANTYSGILTDAGGNYSVMLEPNAPLSPPYTWYRATHLDPLNGVNDIQDFIVTALGGTVGSQLALITGHATQPSPLSRLVPSQTITLQGTSDSPSPVLAYRPWRDARDGLIPPYASEAAAAAGADQTAVIQADLNVLSGKGGGVYYLHAGYYRIAGTLTQPANVTIVGSQKGQTVIVADDVSGPVIQNAAVTAGTAISLAHDLAIGDRVVQVAAAAGAPLVKDTIVYLIDDHTNDTVPANGVIFAPTTVNDGAMTNASTTLACTTSTPFVASPSMVGQPLQVFGAGPGGSVLATTIASFTDTGHVTLATAAGTTVTGAKVVFGSAMRGSYLARVSSVVTAGQPDPNAGNATHANDYVYLQTAVPITLKTASNAKLTPYTPSQPLQQGYRLADLTIQVGTTGGAASQNRYYGVWVSQAERPLIERRQFRNFGWAIGGSPAGAEAVRLSTCLDGVVQDCNFERVGQTGCAISVIESTRCYAFDNTVRESDFGICFYASPKCGASRNRIYGRHLPAVGRGIKFQSGSNEGSARGNEISDTAYYGIATFDCSSIDIDDNTVSSCGLSTSEQGIEVGAYVTGTMGNFKVSNNRVLYPGGSGIVVAPNPADAGTTLNGLISGNTIAHHASGTASGAAAAGIYLQGSRVSVIGNVIDTWTPSGGGASNYGIVSTAGTIANTIDKNRISNGGAGFRGIDTSQSSGVNNIGLNDCSETNAFAPGDQVAQSVFPTTLVNPVWQPTVSVADGAMTAGSAALACATSTPFTAGMVNQTITVLGAGAGGTTLYTTIATFTDSAHVTLAAAASTTVAAASVRTGPSSLTLTAGSTVHLDNLPVPGLTSASYSAGKYAVIGSLNQWINQGQMTLELALSGSNVLLGVTITNPTGAATISLSGGILRVLVFQAQS